MLATLKMLTLAAKLITATSPDVSAAACDAAWERGSDASEACFCSLESYRCEVQGWCGPSQADAVLVLPDVTRVEPGCEF